MKRSSRRPGGPYSALFFIAISAYSTGARGRFGINIWPKNRHQALNPGHLSQPDETADALNKSQYGRLAYNFDTWRLNSFVSVS